MQLEKLGTPVSAETPHRRYAALHRAIESGIAADETWGELIRVCVQLGHHDEALNALAQIRDPRQKRDAEHLLSRRGLLQRNSENEEAPPSTPATLKEQVVDALRILFEDHMPLTTVVTTMTFPLVVGLGGFLTASTSSFLFPAIAALPALCVAAIVGGLGRRILLDAAHGLEEPPRIPELRVLARDSRRFLLDVLVLGSVFLGPAFTLFWVGSPFVSAFMALILGAFLLPGAFLIRQLTEDWRALSPNYLFAAATRLRGEYATYAAICAAVAAPSVAAGVLTKGSQLYLQASVVGPLAVAPLFFAVRLLGQLAHRNRHELRGIVPEFAVSTPAPSQAREETPAPWTTTERPVLRATEPTPPRVSAVAPTRQAAPAPQHHPEAKTPVAPKARPMAPAGAPLAEKPVANKLAPVEAPREPHPMDTITARNRRGVAQRNAQPAAHPAPQQMAQPVAQPAASKAPARPAAPAQPAPAAAKQARPAPARAAQPAPAAAAKVEVAANDVPPDFTQLPGFNVVKGAARVLSGAAARSGKRRS